MRNRSLSWRLWILGLCALAAGSAQWPGRSNAAAWNGVVSTAHAQELPRGPLPVADVAIDNPPIFPLSAVQRGVTGVGYTVFESAVGPEAFGVVVLGVMRNYLGPGEDLIIARLTGDRIRQTGVISGMSGSPVYVDGRVMGAVGYRFGAFTEEPIAGITPIERMLAVAKPLPTEGLRADANASPASGSMRRQLPTSAWGVAEPIAVPIATAGMHPAVADGFADELRKRGYGPLVPAAATGGGGNTGLGGTEAGIYAAGPVAGVLVSGDLMMAGIGTVTWVNRDRFLAFGHPFLGIGVSEMPVFHAEIVTTVASKAGSWKMGQATTPAGRLTDDRLHAIGGTLGAEARTMPMRVRLDMVGPRAEQNATDELSFRVVRHPTDTPLFAAIALANAMSSRVGVERSGTLVVEGNAKVSTGDDIRFVRRVSSDGGALEMSAAMLVLDELDEIVRNGILDVSLREVEVRVHREPTIRQAQITGVKAIRGIVPGTLTKLLVEVRRWEGGTFERTVDVRVPKGLPPGKYRLMALSPRAATRSEQEGGLWTLPSDFDEWVKARALSPSDGDISLYLMTDGEGLYLDGEGFPDVPVSFRDVLSEGGGSHGDLFEKRLFPLTRFDIGGVVAGAASARVQVSDDSISYSAEAVP